MAHISIGPPRGPMPFGPSGAVRVTEGSDGEISLDVEGSPTLGPVLDLLSEPEAVEVELERAVEVPGGRLGFVLRVRPLGDPLAEGELRLVLDRDAVLGILSG